MNYNGQDTSRGNKHFFLGLTFNEEQIYAREFHTFKFPVSCILLLNLALLYKIDPQTFVKDMKSTLFIRVKLSDPIVCAIKDDICIFYINYRPAHSAKPSCIHWHNFMLNFYTLHKFSLCATNWIDWGLGRGYMYMQSGLGFSVCLYVCL